MIHLTQPERATVRVGEADRELLPCPSPYSQDIRRDSRVIMPREICLWEGKWKNDKRSALSALARLKSLFLFDTELRTGKLFLPPAQLHRGYYGSLEGMIRP